MAKIRLLVPVPVVAALVALWGVTLVGQTEQVGPDPDTFASLMVPVGSLMAPQHADERKEQEALIPPVAASGLFSDLQFTKDYFPGTRDVHGEWFGGTETMRLLRHQGKLFASTGDWMDIPYMKRKGEQPWTGPQILVKESAVAPWRVDVSFRDGCVRVDAMISAIFSTDGSGRKLGTPVNLLIASPSTEKTCAWARDDATGKWFKSVVGGNRRDSFRSFCTHVDTVTRMHHLFGGSSRSGSIFRAVYDPAASGRLRWDPEPELTGTGRVMCMAEANDVLYAACGIKGDDPSAGGLFRRVDGEKPRWELIWRWPHVTREKGDETEIMRGLTAVPDPSDAKREVLLGACAYPGVVYRIDPARNNAVTTELDVRAYFAKVFGVANLRGPCLISYNNFCPAVHPDTGEKTHLIGVWINAPDGKSADKGASAWYLVRHADGTYSHGRIFDPNNPNPTPPRGLVATRTIEVSPFPEDKGRVFYFGGYDCAGVESHNTAWIYRGELPSFMKPDQKNKP